MMDGETRKAVSCYKKRCPGATGAGEKEERGGAKRRAMAKGKQLGEEVFAEEV